MNPRMIPWLQKIFWILGWSALILAAVTIASNAYQFFRPVSPTELSWPKEEFYFLKQVRILFSSLSQAFFAFLVSSVFDMIFHRKPVRSQQTQAFLVLTCIGFVGEGAIGLISWFKSTFSVLPQFNVSSGVEILSFISYFVGLIPNLISFVYAITVYVLFTHFSKLVTFESEVV